MAIPDCARDVRVSSTVTTPWREHREPSRGLDSRHHFRVHLVLWYLQLQVVRIRLWRKLRLRLVWEQSIAVYANAATSSHQKTVTAKLTLQTTPKQFSAVRQSQLAYRDALQDVSRYAFEHGKMSNKVGVQDRTYQDLRSRFGLPAQMACSVPRQVGATYDVQDALDQGQGHYRSSPGGQNQAARQGPGPAATVHLAHAALSTRP